jgi:hypothetical protein
MKEFNLEQHWIETASALEIVRDAEVNAATLERHAAYVGLDVHKDTIAVAVAAPGRSEPVYRGEIANKPNRVQKLLTELGEAYGGALLQFCYEAGPCGYVLYHQIIASDHDCQVVAPSRIPKTPGERIKTDRRDALKLARLLRAGDLTAVWVPDQDQEMMRDLSSFKNGQLGSSTWKQSVRQWRRARELICRGCWSTSKSLTRSSATGSARRNRRQSKLLIMSSMEPNR